MTSLIESDNTSFQSVSDDKINCCICLDDVSNKESYMTDCKHSWCIECNKNLNKNKINNCPICKKVFKNKLDKGMWVLCKNGVFYEWKYLKGSKDSNKKIKIKYIQQKLYNFFLMPIIVSPSIHYSI